MGLLLKCICSSCSKRAIYPIEAEGEYIEQSMPDGWRCDCYRGLSFVFCEDCGRVFREWSKPTTADAIEKQFAELRAENAVLRRNLEMITGAGSSYRLRELYKERFHPAPMPTEEKTEVDDSLNRPPLGFASPDDHSS